MALIWRDSVDDEDPAWLYHTVSFLDKLLDVGIAIARFVEVVNHLNRECSTINNDNTHHGFSQLLAIVYLSKGIQGVVK